MPPDQVRELLQGGHPKPRHGNDAMIEQYLRELPSISHRGYAVNYSRTLPDEVGIAAAIHDHRGDLIAAVLLEAPAYHVEADMVANLGGTTLATATNISQRMGGAARRR